MKLKTSVVISTYNGENYILNQLESIHRQTRQADEVIISDDCSADSTVDICSSFIGRTRLKNWSVIKNDQNKGWKKNFIDGLSAAKGDLIFFCDQDDIWKDNKIAEMSQIMESRSEIDVLTSNCEAFYPDGNTVLRPEPENGEVIKRTLDRRVFDTKYPGCTYCIRRGIAKQAVKYWQADFPHDALLWRMAMFKGSLYSYNKSLIRWRQHNDSAYSLESISSKDKSAKREWIEYAKRSIYMIQQYIQDENCATHEKQYILIENLKWLECRARFYDTHSIIIGLKLFRYHSYYPKLKQYFGDWYLVFVKR